MRLTTVLLVILGIALSLFAILLPQLQFYYNLLELGELNDDRLLIGREGCTKLFSEAEACETINLLGSIAFMACDKVDERLKWWPPLANLNQSGKATGQMFTLDLSHDSPQAKALKYINFNEELYAHGSSIFASPDDATQITIAMINHLKSGSVIDFFNHRLGSDEMTHAERIKNSNLLPKPNNLILTGPRSFYATNDLKYASGLMREIEVFLAFSNGHVVFHDGETKKMRIVAKSLSYANGIALSSKGDTLYVAEATGKKLGVYERKPSNNLRLLEKLAMPMIADNVWMDPMSGNIYVAGLSNPLQFVKYRKNPAFEHQPGIVVKVSNSSSYERFLGRQYQIDIVFKDDGSFIDSPTMMVFDSASNKSLIGGLLSKNILICAK